MTVEALAAWFRNFVIRGNTILQGGVHVKVLVLEDLIRNVHILFDERPSSHPTVHSPHVAETTELPRPGLVGVVPTSTPSSFSSSPSDVALESRPTPSPTNLPNPLLGTRSPNTLVEGMETASQEQVRGSEAVDTLVDSPPPEVVFVPPTSIAEWQLRLSQLPQEAATTPQTPPESVFSSTTDLPLSSIMSL